MEKQVAIFSDRIEGKALSQFYDAMKQDYVVQGALMPDAHAGYSLPIGAVVATRGKILPSWVGYDIGCGVLAVKTSFKLEAVRNKAKAIFDRIYRDVPVGFTHHAKARQWVAGESLPTSDVLRALLARKGMTDLHTLGGGNHFIELAHDESDAVWIVIHSGSRGLGHSVATHYMKQASGGQKAREGHYPLDEDSDEGRSYITDLAFCLEYALENRRGMVSVIENAVSREVCVGKVQWDSMINRNHNHAEKRADGLWVHRKGATHAEDGMLGIVAGSMRDGSFVVRGKGNAASLCSSSHGAGRVMGRGEAKRVLDMQTFKAEMMERGIQARINESTLDESAGAYKNVFEVMEMQRDLVEVVHHLQPVINIKG